MTSDLGITCSKSQALSIPAGDGLQDELGDTVSGLLASKRLLVLSCICAEC